MAIEHGQRSMHDWLERYSQDHQHSTNRLLHWICVPLIAWSVLALLWTIPVPASLLRPGAWAVFAIVLAFAWYWKHSHRLGAALLVALAIFALICAGVFERLGPVSMRWVAVCVFVAAWVGQFIGHLFEGRRLSFFTDLAYLLVGPAWLMDKLLNRIGLKETP
ncbi:MAG TPA: Mpo1-like protein [Dyella sp.]|uniref:Mpo1 family 2-hydroxy fatty acid dioxygenase n=1 Tax=Dyella sp. TaxID=1869338 RepID=UPI002B9E9416|nr:Mpo1-like protein [Dyella sp.]HUB92067.1 Mpo1-like protein [Dyella sp.]